LVVLAQDLVAQMDQIAKPIRLLNQPREITVIPTQQIQYLGFLIDSQEMKISGEKRRQLLYMHNARRHGSKDPFTAKALIERQKVNIIRMYGLAVNYYTQKAIVPIIEYGFCL